MRIVHLSTQHRALDVRIFQKECRTLAAHGYETHLLIADPPGADQHGVRFHRLRKSSTNFRPGRIWQRLTRCYRAARSLRADVYHFHDPELITVALLLKRRGARIIYDVHEDAPQEALTLNKDRLVEKHVKSGTLSFLEELAKRHFDGFVCATPAIARKFPADRTITLQNFPLLDEFDGERMLTQSPYKHRPLQFIYSGGISEIRGIREMVQAATLLPTSQLVLLGQFYDPDLQAEMAQIAGWANVDYLGWQDRPILEQRLAQARLGLVLYHPEKEHLDAYPNKMFEYMSAGLPVVASNFPLWQRIVTETGCGLTVDPFDPAAIAEAIARLLANPDEAAAMGRRGRDAILRRYNWEAEAEKLLHLYQRLERAA